MSIFGSLLGAGVSAIGGALSSKSSSKAAKSAVQAQQPLNVFGPGGSTVVKDGNLTQVLSPALQRALHQLERARSFEFERAFAPMDEELERLREIARPEEERALSQTRSRLFNQGRLGLGVGGGRTGNLFNPELAALQEALATNDLNRVGFVKNQQQRNLENFLSLQRGETALSGANQQPAISLGGRLSPQGAAPLFAAGRDQGNFIGGLFGGLGQSIGDSDFLEGIFGNQGGVGGQGTGGSFASSLGQQFNSTGFGF